ncbi:MAG: signal recognition particle-docking protein FtsY [Deltaproteobacteria bacterium]|nr:signal recognition particle-docking protein FtsY [Deltaproteobacteria bacterium]
MKKESNNSTGVFGKLKEGLSKTRKSFIRNMDEMIFGEKVISRDSFEELEELLIMADLGPTFTYDLIDEIKEKSKRGQLQSSDGLKKILMEKMIRTLEVSDSPFNISKYPEIYTIMVVGVNGTGKTTTIGKMAGALKKDGNSVTLVAADTFRAAAIEQLEIWSRRVDVTMIRHQMGSDPSAVVYDAIHSAKARKSNVMIIDTAGRLHTKANLMEELKKIKRIMGRELTGAPHETFLVLDATTGQNAIPQAKMFHDAIGITGIVLTKLDGTAKGGIVIRIAEEMKLPIRYVGIGEGLDDLKRFDSREFVKALFE